MNAMQKKTGIIALLVCGFIAAGQVSHADSRTGTLPPVPLTADPQYVIINFADPKEQFAYTYQTSEASYEAVIKPALQSAIMEFRDTLGAGTDTRRYAWSTIHTYNEYPQSSGEAYLTYVERMLDLAEETDVPVYIPLNGFQWWNQMPELWNWFDPDGNAIAGCTNADYADCPFPELRDPAYRARYIAGYNPENRYNVEWQDVSTPMMPNWRNWGGGAFMHAPIPNLIHHSGAETSFRTLQEKRVDAISKLIAARVADWHQNGKAYLFAGLSIGTEVSLHATLEPDGPFLPYGYRGMQDYLLTTEAQAQASTAPLSRMSDEELRQLREAVVSDYLNTLAAIAVRNGLPKQRIYTHVASEFEPDKPETYVNYFRAAQSYFARPGLSLYPYAANPFLLDPLDTTLAEYGEPAWAVPETQLPALSWEEGVPALLANDRNSAKLIVVYNEREIRGGEAIGPLRQILSQQEDTAEPCTVPEIQASLSSGNGSQMARLPWYQRMWDYVSGYTEDPLVVQVEQIAQISDTADASPVELLIFDEAVPLPDTAPLAIATASSSFTASEKPAPVAVALPRQLDAGTYTVVAQQTGCDGRRWTTATPLSVAVSERYNTRWWKR